MNRNRTSEARDRAALEILNDLTRRLGRPPTGKEWAENAGVDYATIKRVEYRSHRYGVTVELTPERRDRPGEPDLAPPACDLAHRRRCAEIIEMARGSYLAEAGRWEPHFRFRGGLADERLVL